MNLEETSALLAERFGERGAAAARRLQNWMNGDTPYAYADIVAQHFHPDRLGLLFDCFWQVLPFGTGGRRGRVGYGANRINPTTIAMAIQGHCDYLRQRFAERSELAVVVANDVRVFKDIAGTYSSFLPSAHPLLGVSSRSFAKLACEIYAANGIIAYLQEPHSDSAVLSTPELSFTVVELGAVGGIVLSASHNPPDDNGVKLYDEFGGQPVAPDDQRLLDTMNAVQRVSSLPLAEALAQGLVRPIPKPLHEKYVQRYVALYGDFFKPEPRPPVVYSPLCGVGGSTVGDVLSALGFPVKMPPQEGPDGTFEVIPFRSPNPEVPQSTGPAQRFADGIGSEIVLSSDPDADRVGVEVKLPNGAWCHFDGNQIAAIITYALMLDPKGPRRKGLVIETLVTTKLLGAIAKRRGDSPLIDDLLVGFKYVADILKSLAATGRYRDIEAKPEDLVIAAEESHGVCMLPTIMDKDSTPACMYLAGLYQRLRLEGRTLLDYYEQILREVGPIETASRSLTMLGADGIEQRDRIMERLRSSTPAEFAGQRVKSVVDHWDPQRFGEFRSESDKLPRNVIEIFTERFVLIVRPSGTEPKVKFYCHLLEGKLPDDPEQPALPALRQQAFELTSALYNDLLALLDLHLSDASLLLPDMIDIARKASFDRDVLPEVERRLIAQDAGADPSPLLDWLRETCSAYIPGADPLPALKAPLAALCRRLEPSHRAAPLCQAVATWAAQ